MPFDSGETAEPQVSIHYSQPLKDNRINLPHAREDRVLGPHVPKVGRPPEYDHKRDGNVFTWIVAAAESMRPKESDPERYAYQPKMRKI